MSGEDTQHLTDFEQGYDFEGNEWDDITEREKRSIVQGLYERIHYLNEQVLTLSASPDPDSEERT